jgi:SAM-dependent methyltransferase
MGVRTPLLSRRLRQGLVYARLLWFTKVRRRLRLLESSSARDWTVEHNLRSLRQCNDRILRLIRPLAAIESVRPEGDTLVLGPRNENDLLLLYAHGFRWDGLTGVDLISYSPRVELGDMHELPFPDDSFDTVVFGWTLSYSKDPARACQEVARVTRPGGVIAVGVEYTTLDAETRRQHTQLEHMDDSPRSVEAIRKLFGEAVGTEFFSHDAPLRRSHDQELISDPSSVCMVFARA